MLCGAEICEKYTVCKRNISVYCLNKEQKIVGKRKKYSRKQVKIQTEFSVENRKGCWQEIDALRRYKIIMKGEKLW